MIASFVRALEHWLHGSLAELRGRLLGRRLEIAAGQGEQALARALFAQWRLRRRMHRDLNDMRARVQIRVRGMQLRHLRARRAHW